MRVENIGTLQRVWVLENLIDSERHYFCSVQGRGMTEDGRRQTEDDRRNTVDDTAVSLISIAQPSSFIPRFITLPTTAILIGAGSRGVRV